MLKVYKPAIALTLFLAVNFTGFAQDTTNTQQSAKSKRFNEREFDDKINRSVNNLVNTILVKVGDISTKIDMNVNDIDVNISPKIVAQVNDLVKSIDLDIAPNINLELNDNGNWSGDDQGNKAEKLKSYSKSYPLDAADKIKLSNQYGRIIVNTWDKREVKVDVEIKATAESDDEAQRLLDGVQIRDGKSGGLVSFRTSIEPNMFNNSWKIWNWGNNKKHKVEINYTVYMPAKTDLNVEDSYGGIQLPDLDGKVRISSSYGSVEAQNLSNAADEIEGSYGSLKVADFNGSHLDYSYGSVDLEECNNLKADLSYGSCKVGKLKGAADFDLSYVGGFKIDEVGASFKRLNVNASYSGVSLGMPGNNNFDFDITTTYGGFSYNDDKVTITSKTPDDSKYYSSTKNFKGHYGKAGSEAQVNVHSTYGSVHFE